MKMVIPGSWKCEFHKNRAKCTGSTTCHNQVFARNLCVRHGGKKPCLSEGCTGNARIGNFCSRHGASTMKKHCTEEGCTKVAHARQKCVRHGGGRRCRIEACEAHARNGGYCFRHSRLQAQGITLKERTDTTPPTTPPPTTTGTLLNITPSIKTEAIASSTIEWKSMIAADVNDSDDMLLDIFLGKSSEPSFDLEDIFHTNEFMEHMNFIDLDGIPVVSLRWMRIVDVIRGGVCVRGSPKLSSAIRALSWRDAYINQPEFCVSLGSRTLRVRQIANGEVNGLGTGLSVWPAACVLLKYLEHEYGYLKGKAVLELGCGTGVVGLAAALLGADQVVLTDQDQVQFLIHHNAQLNHLSQDVVVATYDWGTPLKGPLAQSFDFVLISDCILPKLYPIEPLVAAILQLCAKRTTVLIAYEYRYFPEYDPKDRFWSLIHASGLVIADDKAMETGGVPNSFTFDNVFGEESTQKQVFEQVAKPVVSDVLEGYNATIFAYGQTSSGKTFTMEGASIDDPALRGIIPRTATELFARLMDADENMEFVVKVSYIEIYMERIRDLLDPYKTKINLQVREDTEKGIYVDGVTELCVTSDDELLSTMRSGAVNRAVAATGMNEGSSRSHSVFMVTLYQRNLETNSTKVGKLYLVDLAGSEMVRKTQASGKQLEEAKTINKSLSALGMVINALTTANVGFVPYRDSKLTRVLQESLGGNSRTALIINVSPSSYNAMETLSTLRFGSRAKNIKNKAVVNAEKSAEEYKQLLAKAEKAMTMQQNYILVLETKLKQQQFQAAIPIDDGASTSSDGQSSSELAALAALEKLQERVVQLEEQLSEEKQESTRRGEEIRSLTAVLNESQMAVEAFEAQKGTWEVARQDDHKSRQLLEELSHLKLELDKLQFENEEIKLHVTTLQQENERLKAESDSRADNDEDLVSATTSMTLSPVTPVAPPSPPRPSTTTIRVDDEEKEQRVLRLESELKAAQEELMAHQTQAQKEIQRFTDERRQLTNQIQELANQLQSVQSTHQAVTAASGMSARERQHMRSIQQKLEQLVAVHRQLLRKYASLESEHNEARQKLGLRD
ncbi:kinesin, partial [Thraustotheca clavata]